MTKPRGFVRKTKQRGAILRVLRNTDTHPTADWIYQEVRKEMPNVSLGTIYRNLKTLVEMGEVQELSYGSGHTRYDAKAHNHYHFVCDECGKIEDLDIPCMRELNENVEEEVQGHVREHRLEFYGVCAECLAEQNSKTGSVS